MKKHILVIEDEVNIKDTIADILELKGYRVTSAEDGQAGFFSVIKEIPDLILCDIMMPKMNGFEVLEAVRGYMKTRTIPFIFLTAKDNPEDFRGGMDLGADDYLVKPINSEKLCDVISYRLQKHHNVFEKGRRLENKRVGKDLHDTLQQTLLGLNMQIRKTAELAVSERMKQEAAKSLEYVKMAISQLRLILESQEENSGQDLYHRVAQMSERLVGYIDFDIHLENNLEQTVCGDKADALFKAMQEIINNTIKHSKAKNLYITFDMEESMAEIEIKDDGVGFDVKCLTHQRGLNNMCDRLREIAGTLNLNSTPGSGTCISMRFNLNTIN